MDADGRVVLRANGNPFVAADGEFMGAFGDRACRERLHSERGSIRI
jgi:hypothetical protein